MVWFAFCKMTVISRYKNNIMHLTIHQSTHLLSFCFSVYPTFIYLFPQKTHTYKNTKSYNTEKQQHPVPAPKQKTTNKPTTPPKKKQTKNNKKPTQNKQQQTNTTTNKQKQNKNKNNKKQNKIKQKQNKKTNKQLLEFLVHHSLLALRLTVVSAFWNSSEPSVLGSIPRVWNKKNVFSKCSTNVCTWVTCSSLDLS